MYEKSLTHKVIEYLRDNPGASVKDIALALGISTNLARAIVYRLKSKGLLEKSGRGYILTSYAESMISKTLHERKEEKVKETTSFKEGGETKVEETIVETKAVEERENITAQKAYSVIERRLSDIESKIRELENMLNEVKNEFNKIKKIYMRIRSVKNEKSGASVTEKIQKPVMSIVEAKQLYGDHLTTLIYTGKVVVVGSLVVDSSYYNKFLSKFPISRKDAEKLPEPEKILFEELRKEGRIYLHCGKEYRLIS